MSYLSHFQTGQFVAARVAGASVTETSQLLVVSRGTVSKACLDKLGKLEGNSINRSFTTEQQFANHLSQMLMPNVIYSGVTLTKLGRLISGTTRGLLATDHVILNHGQVTWTTSVLAPPLLTTTPHQREDVSALDRLNMHRCPTRRVFSGIGLELVTKPATIRYHSATAAFSTIGQVHVWRTPAHVYDHYSFLPTGKHGSGSVMIGATVSWFSAGPIVTMKGRFTREKYREILVDQVHSMKQTLFPAGFGIFQDDIVPIHAARLVQSLLNTRMKLNIYLGFHSHPTSM
ncbi:uncharacterized protein TNCV_2112191 [Trichonephila clavipes]|nr:uncharacterized protein TNCV_2112191 [Trichonephila clavipes]